MEHQTGWSVYFQNLHVPIRNFLIWNFVQLFSALKYFSHIIFVAFRPHVGVYVCSHMWNKYETNEDDQPMEHCIVWWLIRFQLWRRQNKKRLPTDSCRANVMLLTVMQWEVADRIVVSEVQLESSSSNSHTIYTRRPTFGDTPFLWPSWPLVRNGFLPIAFVGVCIRMFGVCVCIYVWLCVCVCVCVCMCECVCVRPFERLIVGPHENDYRWISQCFTIM